MKVKITETKKVTNEVDLILTSEMAKALHKLAEDQRKIEKELQQEVDNWFSYIQPLEDDDLYFKILDEYRTMILSSRWGLNRVKYAADEIVRRAWCRESFYSFEELVGFHKRYVKVKRELYSYLPLWNAELDKGDDGFSDFLDNIQMVSHDLPQRILAGEFNKEDECDGRVDVLKLRREYDRASMATVKPVEAIKDIPNLADYWWDGENANAYYLIARLEKVAPWCAEDMLALTEEEV